MTMPTGSAPESVRARIRQRPEALHAENVWFQGHDGDEVEAYLVRPNHDQRRGGVVVIHHLPGYDRATKEMTRRLAELGYDAICPNLFWREAPGAAPDDAAALVRAQGGPPDPRVVGDVAGAVAHLRALPTSNQKIGVIGHCSGGRHAVLVACRLELDAVVDCYGGGVTGPQTPGRPASLVEDLPKLSCPLLGLFGNEDARPSPEHVDELEKLLTEHGKTFAMHRYDDAGHSFFAVDRPSYRPAAANDGWEKVGAFYSQHLGS
jgi:carboxymethylenebutenolidase